MKKITTKAISYIALLIAADVVLTRFCINTPYMKIGFGFMATAIAAILYGPIFAGIEAACADIIGSLLFPTGAYFPGFTLTAFLTGIVYGIFLKKNIRKTNVIICVLLTSILFSGIANTYWLSILTGKGIIALLPKRIIQTLIMIPIQIFGLFAANKIVNRTIQKNY